MFKIFVLIIIGGFIYESIFWLFRIWISFSWVKRERLLISHRPIGGCGKIYVLIPVFIESEILEDTVKYFSNYFLKKGNDVFLIIVTTEKEKLVSNSKNNTIDVAKKLASEYQKVIHIHFPEKRGKMAHQLNYAIHNLINCGIIIQDNDLIAVYNADSRPEKKTLDWVKCKFQEGGCSVFQQYGCYSGNILRISNAPWASVLVSGALWQIRWSIGFEIYNALKQLKFLHKKEIFLFNYPFNYCIGHGLFITKKLLDKVGGFSENTHNEDAILGLQLSDIQEIIMPVPYFDISDSPDTLKMLYIQKSNWYFGPLQAYSYMINILKNLNYGMFRRLRLVWLSSKLFLHAFFWIIGPTLMFLGLVLAVISRDVVFICLSLFVTMLFAVPNIVSYIFMTRLKTMHFRISFRRIVKLVSRGFFVCYMMHGVSAYRGLYKYTKQILVGKEAIKEKTMIRRISEHGRM